MQGPDGRIARLAELQEQFKAIGQELVGQAPGSPELLAVLERWAPVHAAVLALVDELEAWGKSSAFGMLFLTSTCSSPLASHPPTSPSLD